MSTQLLPQSFPSAPNSVAVFTDTPTVGGTAGVGPLSVTSSGIIRAVDAPSQPTLSQSWLLLGWSVRLRVGTFFPDAFATHPQPWANFGQLLAGVAINANLPTQRPTFPAILPSDMSTFTEVWDPNEDCGPIVQSISQDETLFKPIAITYIFPGGPIEIIPGTQLQLALILLPSLVGASLLTVLGPIVRSAAITLIYELKERH